MFITDMAKESKYKNHVMKNHFNKELITSKEDDKNFESYTVCWVCDNTFVEGDVNVRNHCHITGKYSDCTWRL